MPELGDYSRHLQGVDTHILQRSSTLWATSNCYCARSGGVKSEIYDTCVACCEVDQDVKLLPDQKHALLPADGAWEASEIINIPLAPAVKATEEADVVDAVAYGPSSQQVIHTTRARAAQSDDRDHLSYARSSPRRSCTSPYRGHGQRGRPPKGSRIGPPGFKGVRQRKGVRGFLVEIRPPRWKKTIWLGTYNSDREAAAAYDAGIFYTKKKTKYNFDILANTFPALPAELRLDDADDHEEIKAFVQREAREAARTINNMPAVAPPPAAPAAPATPEPTRETTSSSRESSYPSNIPASTTTSTCSDEESAMALTISEVDWITEIVMWDYCLDGIM